MLHIAQAIGVSACYTAVYRSQRQQKSNLPMRNRQIKNVCLPDFSTNKQQTNSHEHKLGSGYSKRATPN